MANRTLPISLLATAIASLVAAVPPATAGDTGARALDETPSGLVAANAAWQLGRTELPLAWQVTEGDASVVVAVLDTGVDALHPGFEGRVLPGWNFVAGNADTSDDNGHGTAVAGIIASAATAGGSAGACPKCRILPVKVLGADGTGDWGTIAAGIVWAADHGAQVINLSFGAPHVLDVVGNAISYALSKGAIVVAAAGNDGSGEPFYPAAFPGVVSVAGVDADTARYSWSNFGGWVTVAAPGCLATTWVGDQYRPDFCGTSAAAPFVSGLAGLARSYRPSLVPDAFSHALASTTLPVASPGTTSSGLVDANRLLVALGAPAAPPTATGAPTVAGAPVVGRTLAARPVSWQGAASVQYQWQRSRGGVHWRVAGSGPRYLVRPADVGWRLRIAVSAVNARGSTAADSSPTVPVSRPAQDLRRPT